MPRQIFIFTLLWVYTVDHSLETAHGKVVVLGWTAESKESLFWKLSMLFIWHKDTVSSDSTDQSKHQTINTSRAFQHCESQSVQTSAQLHTDYESTYNPQTESNLFLLSFNNVHWNFSNIFSWNSRPFCKLWEQTSKEIVTEALDSLPCWKIV